MQPDVGSRRSVDRHRLSADDLATLSHAEGSPEITRGLWETELSRRLLLVSTLLDEMRTRSDLLDSASSAIDVLGVIAKAQRAAPEGIRDLLLDPQVGSGCAYALRRLRGGAHSAAPIWLDLGVVHALALVAAARAGLKWSTRLPLRDCAVMLPTLGMARFPGGSAATVEGTTAGGRIRLSDGEREVRVPTDGSDVEPSGGRAGWWSLRRVRVGGDLPLTTWLDDLDPLRDLAEPVPPARLDAEAFERWRQLIDDAWGLLCRDYRPEAAAMAGGLISIVPLQPEPSRETRSASNGEAFGSVMLSEPPDPATMAVTLIHEFQHVKLGALLHLIPLAEPDDGSRLYAPWRDDPRPLAGLLQGVYAFAGIAKFWRDRTDGASAAFEYCYTRQQTAAALRTALAAPGLTAAGRSFFAGLQAHIEEWPSDVDPRIARLVEITADSHRIGWRLRHFEPRSEDVAELAGQFAGGEAPRANLAPATLREHPVLRWRQRIPELARRQARDGDTGGGAPGDPLAAGEIALLAQDLNAARGAFVAVLGRPPAFDAGPVTDEAARAWAGLALSVAADGNVAAATALTCRPDLVRAVYTNSAGRLSVTPVEAEWLAPAVDAAE